ncbi:substrate-binding domain-containing protein [Plectonema radiosum NIES-515]|uniref:Substrate-binding domain-containing protein n=1 Tax=Plectonema radiosum NIES-515 TaxID=2986073 RepID=A0ABT3AUL8_9CYAN|nr:substrate-binding domain-containing protein [Plectonema radiosum]MCV3212821.1 substrate-binding domain-containing protein [Plectonema radiosum NIES-515]
MWQKEKKDSSIVSLALLLALTSPAVTLFAPNCVQAAQSATEDPSFPLPQTLENGTKVRIDGSSSMTPINQSLKESFEKQFSGTSVELAANGTNSALKALQDGKIDIATIGRDLTPEEKAQGLEQLRVRREKIAIVVGASNPFKGSLTSKQFAKIFRGEIANWSELGRSDAKIRFIDRPTTSDTRESLRGYPVFKTDKFATGSTATQLADDNTAEMIKELGKDGISYVMVNQISKLQDVRSLKLHNTSPDDPRYPFSQPLVYVYKKNPSLGIAGFLGFTTAKPGIQAIEKARTAEANAIAASLLQTIPPNPTASPTIVPTEGATSPLGEGTNPTTANQNNSPVPVVPTTDKIQNVTNDRISPWWWLLALPVVGGLFWLLGKRGSKSQPTDNIIESSNQPLEEAIPTAALGASVAPPVSEDLSDNQLLRAYAQTQSGAVENTTHMSENLPQGVTNTADNLAEDTTSPVSNITSGGSGLGGIVAIGVGTSIWSPPSDKEAVDETTAIRNNTEIVSPDVTKIGYDAEAPITEVTTAQPPDAPIPTAEAQPPAQSNTSTGGIVAAGGSILWSQLTGSSQREAIAETTQSNNLEEDVWDIETPPAEVTTPKLQYSTTLDASATEVRDSLPLAFDVNIKAPTTEITASVPQQPDVSTIETSKTEVTNSLPLASNVEAAQIPTPASDVNEVTNSLFVASNPEASIIEITPAGAQIHPVASDEDVETPTREITASFPQQPDVSEFVSDEDAETSTREITASFPEPALLEDDWDMEFAQDEKEVQPPAQQFNWLQNITSAGGAVAAGSGAVLWSRSQNRGSQTEATNQTTQTNDGDEDFWDIETPAIESPDVLEVASNQVETPITQITDSLPESPDVPEVALLEDDWDMEFSADETEEQPAQSNWLENITSAGSAVVGGGAVLWSRLSGKGSQPEADDYTIKASNSDEDLWDIETPATQQLDVPESVLNAQLPTVEITPATQQLDVHESVLNAQLPTVEITPATQQLDVHESVLNAQLPTVEITPATQQLDVHESVLNAQLPTVEITPAMLELPDVPLSALDVVADAAEEDLSAESNWLENITSGDDATLEDDISSDLFDLGQRTSLNSAEPRETSAEVTDASLELTANVSIDQDINETVSNVSEPAQNVTEDRRLDLGSGVAFVVAGAGAGAWERIYGIRENTENFVKEDTVSPEKNVESSIAIAPRTAKWAYVSWNVSDNQKKAVQQEFCCQLALRLYDATEIDLNYQTPTLVQQYECEEITHDRYVAIPVSDRDYIAEIGYLINGDRWFLLARSATVRISTRPQEDFWFQADAELIIHGATKPDATVTIGGHSIKLKPDGTFHLRVPFTATLIDYLMTAVTSDEQETIIIHKKFFQESQE